MAGSESEIGIKLVRHTGTTAEEQKRSKFQALKP